MPDGPPSTTQARLVIDLRPPAEFAAGHPAGALNLQWGWSQLRDRIRAYVPDPHTPLALHGLGSSRLEAAREALRTEGYHDVVTLDAPTREVGLATMDIEELERRLAGGDALVLLDVRTPREWSGGTIPGALLIEQDEAPARVDELDPALEYAVICEGGYRSSQLASLMARRGFERVSNVIDGMAAWRRRQR